MWQISLRDAYIVVTLTNQAISVRVRNLIGLRNVLSTVHILHNIVPLNRVSNRLQPEFINVLCDGNVRTMHICYVFNTTVEADRGRWWDTRRFPLLFVHVFRPSTRIVQVCHVSVLFKQREFFHRELYITRNKIIFVRIFSKIKIIVRQTIF